MKKRSKKKAYRPGLPVVRADAAGIDLGSREHWVCCPQREAEQANVRQFATTTVQLKALADWLQQEGVQTVAMESTGLYWVALYDLLEERGLEVLLVDARQLKRVPGRCKTDNRDCQWIHRQVRGIEEIEGDVVGMFDQRVAELRPVFVEIADESCHPYPRVPTGVTYDGNRFISFPPLMLGGQVICKPLGRGDRIIPQKSHPTTHCRLDAAIASRSRTRMRLAHNFRGNTRRPLLEPFPGAIRRTIINDDHLEVGDSDLTLDRTHHFGKSIEPIVGWNHNRQSGYWTRYRPIRAAFER